jgi:hypothetical protein
MVIHFLPKQLVRFCGDGLDQDEKQRHKWGEFYQAWHPTSARQTMNSGKYIRPEFFARHRATRKVGFQLLQ